MLVAGTPTVVVAHDVETTQQASVRHEAGDGAPDVGLIGDSTLSGVRWFGDYGELERFNFVFDAESCRRTVERSCWSREQYRPRNALTALYDEAGDWGDVLVMMSGYNDSADGFAGGVLEIVDEARRQGIGTVVWLSLRTKGVDYEEPLHLANGSTYRDANRSLYELADDLGGYLQIADWATYSADSPEWFEADGAHLAEEGAQALTDFLADQIDVVLSGGTITPDPPPWEEVREGDEGDEVVDVQQALIATGSAADVIADGVYGPQTVDAVTAFQRTAGLEPTGAVDDATAEALGLHAPPPAAMTTVPETSTTSTPPATLAAVVPPPPAGDENRGSGPSAWWFALALVPAAILVLRRTRTPVVRRDRMLAALAPPNDPPATAALYDHELEDLELLERR